jgi:hypothetical protein
MGFCMVINGFAKDKVVTSQVQVVMLQHLELLIGVNCGWKRDYLFNIF